MHEILDFLRTLTNPERLIALLSTVITGWYGYALLFAIVFAETGLLVGFFLPGDSLLFTVGVVAGAGQLNVWVIMLLLIVAAAGQASRTAGVQPSRFKVLQAGVPSADEGVLRKARRENDYLRAIHSDHPDVRSICGGSGADALLTILKFQYFRRDWLGDQYDDARLHPR
jgi:hypothetical protein